MDEQAQTYIITFDTLSAADANRYTEELRQALLDASPDVQVHRRRDDPRTQDFGATAKKRADQRLYSGIRTSAFRTDLEGMAALLLMVKTIFCPITNK